MQRYNIISGLGSEAPSKSKIKKVLKKYTKNFTLVKLTVPHAVVSSDSLHSYSEQQLTSYVFHSAMSDYLKTLNFLMPTNLTYHFFLYSAHYFIHGIRIGENPESILNHLLGAEPAIRVNSVLQRLAVSHGFHCYLQTRNTLLEALQSAGVCQILYIDIEGVPLSKERTCKKNLSTFFVTEIAYLVKDIQGREINSAHLTIDKSDLDLLSPKTRRTVGLLRKKLNLNFEPKPTDISLSDAMQMIFNLMKNRRTLIVAKGSAIESRLLSGVGLQMEFDVISGRTDLMSVFDLEKIGVPKFFGHTHNPLVECRFFSRYTERFLCNPHKMAFLEMLQCTYILYGDDITVAYPLVGGAARNYALKVNTKAHRWREISYLNQASLEAFSFSEYHNPLIRPMSMVLDTGAMDIAMEEEIEFSTTISRKVKSLLFEFVRGNQQVRLVVEPISLNELAAIEKHSFITTSNPQFMSMLISQDTEVLLTCFVDEDGDVDTTYYATFHFMRNGFSYVLPITPSHINCHWQLTH